MRRRVWGTMVCAALAACAGASTTAAAADHGAPPDPRTVRPAGMHGPLGDERLSDERRLTRHAGAVSRAIVRSRPSTTAPEVGRLRYLTEDGPFEVYLVLESLLDDAGRTWVRVRLPMRPNGRTGWVPRSKVGPLRIVRTLMRINRRTPRATLYRGGRPIWSSAIGVGADATPTPAGHFWVRTRLRGMRSAPTYGPYAFGTAAYSVLSDWPGGGVIGIHGTNQPKLIPGRPSHGCIRVPNAAITRLWRLMPVGTPVEIV